MQNFAYYNPVRIVFGRDTIAELPQLIPPGAKVMMVYGGGSIKKNGVYDQVLAALGAAAPIEFGGIEPNPHYETCMEAVELARRENVDFLLAVGGGSVVDATKFIAAAARWNDGDPWRIVQPPRPVLAAALPFGCVITLPATGSEMNFNAVISRVSTREKLHFGDPLVYPKFSIIDPASTFSLPPRQTVNGIVDTYVHVMEQYLTFDNAAPLQDRFAESIVKTLIETSPRVLANPEDYDARANLCWCATMALNGLIGCGVAQDWATHMIGHELTAVYGLDHAVTLAIVMPALWRARRDAKQDKLVRYGREVFGIDTANPAEAAETAIVRTEEFFHAIGMKTRLADYGIDADAAAGEIANRLRPRGERFGEREDIGADAAAAILRRC